MNQNEVGVWRALFGWIDQPKKTLRYVMKEPRWSLWLAPALIILVSSIIVVAVSAPFLSEVSREQAEQQIESQMPSMSGEQEEHRHPHLTSVSGSHWHCPGHTGAGIDLALPRGPVVLHQLPLWYGQPIYTDGHVGPLDLATVRIAESG